MMDIIHYMALFLLKRGESTVIICTSWYTEACTEACLTVKSSQQQHQCYESWHTELGLIPQLMFSIATSTKLKTKALSLIRQIQLRAAVFAFSSTCLCDLCYECKQWGAISSHWWWTYICDFISKHPAQSPVDSSAPAPRDGTQSSYTSVKQCSH